MAFASRDLRGTRAPSRWRAAPRELVLVLSGILVYFGVRGITVTDVQSAMDNALGLVRFERTLGLYVEPQLQEMVHTSSKIMTVMNWIYIWGHWPVIAGTLLWLFMQHYEGYRQIRNAMLLSGAVGLVIFAAFPVAPPRLADLGLIDTVTEYSTSYRVLQPPAFVNQYAAMPSLHVGWDLLIGIAIFTYSRHVLLKAVGVVLPTLMVTAVVLTANHYIVDAVVGVTLVLVCLFAVNRFGARRVVARIPIQRSGARDRPDRSDEADETRRLADAG